MCQRRKPKAETGFGFASLVICISALSGLTPRIFKAEGPSLRSLKDGLDFRVSPSVVTKLQIHRLIERVCILEFSMAQPGFLFCSGPAWPFVLQSRAV